MEDCTDYQLSTARYYGDACAKRLNETHARHIEQASNCARKAWRAANNANNLWKVYFGFYLTDVN